MLFEISFKLLIIALQFRCPVPMIRLNPECCLLILDFFSLQDVYVEELTEAYYEYIDNVNIKSQREVFQKESSSPNYLSV